MEEEKEKEVDGEESVASMAQGKSRRWRWKKESQFCCNSLCNRISRSGCCCCCCCCCHHSHEQQQQQQLSSRLLLLLEEDEINLTTKGGWRHPLGPSSSSSSSSSSKEKVLHAFKYTQEARSSFCWMAILWPWVDGLDDEGGGIENLLLPTLPGPLFSSSSLRKRRRDAPSNAQSRTRNSFLHFLFIYLFINNSPNKKKKKAVLSSDYYSNPFSSSSSSFLTPKKMLHIHRSTRCVASSHLKELDAIWFETVGNVSQREIKFIKKKTTTTTTTTTTFFYVYKNISSLWFYPPRVNRVEHSSSESIKNDTVAPHIIIKAERLGEYDGRRIRVYIIVQLPFSLFFFFFFFSFWGEYVACGCDQSFVVVAY